MKAAHLAFCLGLAAALTSTVAQARDFSDPDWPCIQRKVGDLSLGLMWSDPIEPETLTPEAANLVSALSLRRVSAEAADARVQAFVEGTKSVDARLLGNVFQGVFENISDSRRQLISGIARYSHSQIALAEKIRAGREEMTRLSADKNPDFDRIDALEAQLDWNERIYRDRAKSLTYVCETPVLLEKRAYAIAQILQKYVPK